MTGGKSNTDIRQPPITGRPGRFSGRASDSGARGPGFEPHERGIVSLSKTLL